MVRFHIATYVAALVCSATAFAQPALECPAGAAPLHAPPPVPEDAWYCVKPDGTREGPFETRFPDGTPSTRGVYVKGKLEGPWERHAPGGTIVEEGTYVAGHKDGHWKQSTATGSLIGEYDLPGGTGTEKTWLPDGTLYRERGMRKGKPHGTDRFYTSDGQVIDVAHYYAGSLDGPHQFGSKANLRIEETFGGGTRRGKRSIWQFWLLLAEENFDNGGHRDGEYTLWRSKTIQRVHGQYAHGKRDGVWTWNDRSGNKEKEGTYIEGKKDGVWNEWYENKLASTATYVDGKVEGDVVIYDHSEKELGRYTMTAGTGTVETYYPNKKVSSRQHQTDGDDDGIYQELTPRGRVTVEGHYRSDLRSGSWKEQTELGVPTLEQHWAHGRLYGVVRKFVNGKVSMEATYKDGKAEGAYTEFRDGKPSLTGRFGGDRKQGTWTTYGADGSVTLVATYKDGVLEGPWKQVSDGVTLEGAMAGGHRAGTWKRTDKSGTTTTSY